MKWNERTWVNSFHSIDQTSILWHLFTLTGCVIVDSICNWPGGPNKVKCNAESYCLVSKENITITSKKQQLFWNKYLTILYILLLYNQTFKTHSHQKCSPKSQVKEKILQMQWIKTWKDLARHGRQEKIWLARKLGRETGLSTIYTVSQENCPHLQH